VALVTHTITGQVLRPDGVTPLVGTWYVELVSDTGSVLDHDEDGFRAGIASHTTDETGAVNWTLPATHQPGSEPMDYFYRIWFSSEHGDVKVEKQYITLDEDSTIDELLEAPTVVPVTPSMVSQAEAAADRAEAAAASVPQVMLVPAGTPGWEELDQVLWVEYNPAS
jgi:hypothetical protein